MSVKRCPSCAAERYDDTLLYARKFRLTPNVPQPLPTRHWPVENVALLERYAQWLAGGGASHDVIQRIYIPMAGHTLGLHLKPHHQIRLDSDLDKAMAYIDAKGTSAEWRDMCRCGLGKFRQFLRQERGLADQPKPSPSKAHYCQALPDWLTRRMEGYCTVHQRNWRPARFREQTSHFWLGTTRLWRWVCAAYPLSCLSDLKRTHVLAYIDHCLKAGYAVSTINGDIRTLHGFLLHLQDQGETVPQALLHTRCLKERDRLPKFLTDDQVRRLGDDFEQQVVLARLHQRRDALLSRAAFYLLWQAGLRLGEAEDLGLEDLDLAGRKLTVRRGKGGKDRTVYLTETTAKALGEYLAVRGVGATTHVFLYRNRPIQKDLIRSRIKAAGERTGVKVHPHRLRHTCATQLLNAGCRVTSIQKLLGHKRLNSTMIYARVHDQTVADDYYAAMARIEGRLEPQEPTPGLPPDTGCLLALLEVLDHSTVEVPQRETLQALRAGIIALASRSSPAHFASAVGECLVATCVHRQPADYHLLPMAITMKAIPRETNSPPLSRASTAADLSWHFSTKPAQPAACSEGARRDCMPRLSQNPPKAKHMPATRRRPRN